ncbi:DUF4407 domain-containing protein [Microbispora sp. CA-135349]|uniref:DUF4407 domain-containing protein n=1 Tax=Microbispora sp. CA-135349 TaxID=3239953 RepID=UPI003D94A968
MSEFLAWLGGGEKEALRHVPTERSRFTQMALVLLTTAGLAVVSMAFALHDGLKVDWLWAVVFGLLWGFVILNLDRLLVLSMGSIRDRKRVLLMALPRLGMAMVLAVVISTPLVLRVFASDINVQIYTTQQETSARMKLLQANSAEQDRANKLRQKIQEDQEILAGKLSRQFTSPQLQTAQAKVSELQRRLETGEEKANVALEAWKCELYGAGEKCRKASDKAGPGPLAATKEREYRQAVSAVRSVRTELKAARAAASTAEKGVADQQAEALRKAQDDARAELPGLQAQYREMEASLQASAARGTTLNGNDDGLPAQVRALFELGERDLSLSLAHLAVFFLFFMIELLPVTVKILINMGPMSPYEAFVKFRGDAQIDEAKTRRVEARRIEEGRSRVRVEVAEGKERVRGEIEADMRRREADLGKRANAHVAAEMTKILDIALQEWSEQVRSRLAKTHSDGDGTPPPSHGTTSAPGDGGFTMPPVNGVRPPTVQVTSPFFLPDGDDL